MSYTKAQIDEITAQRLADPNLKPDLVAKVKRLIQAANFAGTGVFVLMVSQGFRSIAQQNALFAQGRTKAGKIVTNARGGKSNHNFGKAVDFAFAVRNAKGTYDISWDDKLYKKLGAWASMVDLKWGGNFKTFKDMPHVEI